MTVTTQNSEHTFGHPMLKHWSLEPDIVYLNHGTVGVTPNRVMRAQQAIRDEIERQPARFMLRELEHHTSGPFAQTPRIRAAADAVAAFLGARGGDLVFVDNATTGINAVLRSLPFAADDEILMLDLAYGAVTNTAHYVARARGATVITVHIPFPNTDPNEVVDLIAKAITARTKILVVDHIAAFTSLILPLPEIAAACHAKNVPVLVDGAHAPGALELNIAALGVDWYVGNLHKWAFAPRGCGILWASPERQQGLHPTVISWGLDQGFTQEFDLLGTKDPSASLVAPEAIAFIRDLGETQMRQHNHALAWQAAHWLADDLGTTFTTRRSMAGALVSVPLPERAGSSAQEAFALQHALLYQDRIEIPILAINGGLYARISAQVYNQMGDIERLGQALQARLQ
jgi:isopenicillin-N epimerase